MAINTFQYCHAHKEMESFPACDNGYAPGLRTSKNAQLPPGERPVIWENPLTGEVRYPPRKESPMLQAYKDRGFQRKEFTSYNEHQQWCKSHDVINHAAEGIKDSALKDGK